MWKTVLGSIFYFGFLFVALTIGCAAGWIRQSPVLLELGQRRFDRMVGITPSNPFEGQDAITLLVLGCDEDWYYGGKQLIRHKARSDMMLLAKLDFKNNRITGISIPRDTLVAVPGYRMQKINGYHLQGNDVSKTAVETLLPGIHIDRVMALNFDAFNDMVDTVGGVDVYVPKNMNYDDFRGHLHIHLKAGKQHLDGSDAQGFVRFRHTDDDFHRTERQRDFLLSFKQAVFQHIDRLPAVTNKAVEVTDHALTTDEIAAIAEFAQKVGSDNIQMGMLPVVDANDGQFGLLLDTSKVDDVLRTYHFLDDGNVAPSSYVSYRQ